jgi:YVTN family beta-propeller protein
VFAKDRHAWVAAFASDRVAKVDTSTGNVLATVDVRRDGGSSSSMRGPRALVLNPSGTRLYVLNKISDSVTVIDANTNSLLEEVPLTRMDAMPAFLRAGRGFLFDARFSGNGTASCAACHIDADRDGLAWDLGNPSGEMVTVQGANLSVHDLTPRGRVMHPMKGPMVTQTLRGMENGAPFHWRGDRPTLQSFNPTFDRLMGGSELASADIDKMAAYLLSLRNHPNPNREKSGALPPTFANGNPTRGEMLFNLHDNHCGICHLSPRGSDNNIDLPLEVGSSQPVKNPPLATVYQRLFFDPTPGATSLSGFGLLHDGTGSGVALPTVHPYVLDQLSTLADFLDVQAFVLCFDTGTSPAVGDTVTFTAQNTGSADTALNRLELLSPSLGQLVAFASIGGIQHRFLYSRILQRYIPESVTETPLTRQALLASLGPSDAATFMGVPPSQGSRFAAATTRGASTMADSYFVPNTQTVLSVPVIRGVLSNDPNIAPSHDTAEMVSAPGAGEIVLNPDGSFSYTPGAAFAAADVDSFEYRVLVAGDSSNATAATAAMISTIASAAGQYSGVLTSADQTPAGLVNITVSANGAWSGSARIGSKVTALKGTLTVDGTLQPKRTPAFNVALRLTVLEGGQRKIIATSSATEGMLSGTVNRSAYSKSSPAPNTGRHQLTLMPSRIIGDASEKSGVATFKLKGTGVASFVGKLGDGTRFSCSGVVTARGGGGWSFPNYASVYKSPPGSVSGELQSDSGGSSGISGVVTTFKPPQTRPGPFQGGFTIEYTVAE